MNIAYAPKFLRLLKKLPPPLQVEVKEKISLFLEDHRHPMLKAHKLKGKCIGRWSFSVNYSYRIIYMHLSKDEVVFLAIGDHSIYT